MIEFIVGIITFTFMVCAIAYANVREMNRRNEIIAYTLDEICEKNSRSNELWSVSDFRHLLECRLNTRFHSDYIGLNRNWTWRW